MAELLALAAIALLAFSGLPGLFLPREESAGQSIATSLVLAGCAVGLASVFFAFTDPGELLDLGGAADGLRLKVQIDGLSAFFLMPVFLVPAACALYGQKYWPQRERRFRLFFGFVPAGMALLVIARNSLLFLTGWELMALASFFLVTAEEENEKARLAGWHYIVAAHVGMLALIALFALLRQATGSFDFGPIAVGVLSKGGLNAVFLLALVGFGLKAGLMPFHVWLPGAHANAPSHVSALLSGVLLKMGVFGVLRVTGWLPIPPLWWGEAVLALGSLSAVLGILFALGQKDLKRVLAYSSIENIGIIFMGIGLALMGRASGRGDWVALGLGGACLHALNHSLFKPLLFLGAGSVIHATGERDIDRMGGLAKSMPVTAALFLVGSIAICGLPPLNGFVGELLLYLGLFSAALKTTGSAPVAPAFAAPALALTGALALACFVRLYGAVFLGEGRSAALSGAHESPRLMTAPMAALAAGCAVIGLAPFIFAPVLDFASANCFYCGPPRFSLSRLAPLTWVGGAAAALVLASALLIVWTRLAFAKRPPTRAGTWDCGYGVPSARMQYTGTAFARILVETFDWVLRPRTRSPMIAGPFPERASVASDVPDLALDRALVPGWARMERFVVGLRVIQQGLMQVYILYILAATVALLLWW